MPCTRRCPFATLASASAASQLSRAVDEPVAIAGKHPIILHNDRPEDPATPVRHLDSRLTPIDASFARQHLPRPALLERLVANFGDDKPPSPPAMSKDGAPPRKQQ